MTVSRVLNQSTPVSEQLRAKVMASVKALNYSMNMAARSTRSGMGGVRIGVLYSNPSSSYLNEVMLGGLEQSSRLGCQLILEKCSGMESQKAAVRRLVAAGVDGVILPPPLCDSPATVSMLANARIPVLALATGKPLADVSAVRVDDFKGALTMTRHLVKLGHKRIGFIKGDPSHTPTALRYDGYVAGLTEAGIPLNEAWVGQGMFTYRSGLDVGRAMLEHYDRPTAIFASNDDMAAGVIAVAHGMRLGIPEDLSVAGFDDTPIATTIWPELTTIHQPITAMGRSAVSTIFEQIKVLKTDQDAKPVQHVMKFTLMERASTGVAPGRDGRVFPGVLPR